MIPMPVVVLSTPHAGAARIAALLGAHPCALPLPELRLFHTDRVHDLRVMFERAGDRPGDGVLRTVAQLRHHEQTEDAIEEAARWLERRAEWNTGDLLLALLELAAPRTAVLHDTAAPMRVSELDRWFQALPTAHYVHLLRHPAHFVHEATHDVEGMLNVPPDYKDHGGKYPRIDPQLLWYRVHDTLVRELPAHPEAIVHTLRSEDLHADPRRTLAALCRSLGWAHDDAVLDTMLAGGRNPFAGPGPVNAPAGVEKACLEEPDFHPRLAERRRHDLLTDAGFAPEVASLARAWGYS